VQVAARPIGARVELEVRDHGPGMTPEQRARAFDRFWRSSGSRRTDGGFGLGLPIVRRLVLADGGDVRLVDAPGGGLAVVVSLPATRPMLRATA
jgi:signal transduction histidine kinase